MSTTTLATLRQKFLIATGEGFAETTSGAGAVNSVVCANLSNKPDSYYNNWWVTPTSGVCSGQHRELSGFTSTTGAMVPYSNFTAAVNANIGIELHRYNPTGITNAFNDAIKETYPTIRRDIVDENIISGNWLYNGGFEDWALSTTPDNWVSSAVNMSLAKNTAIANRKYGAASCNCVTNLATTELRQTQAENKRLLDLAGYEVTLRAWVKATVAGAFARLNDGTTTTDGTASTLTDQMINVTATMKKDMTSFRAAILPVDTGAVYVDQACLFGPALYDYKMPSPIKAISQIWMQTAGMALTSNSPAYACDDVRSNYPMQLLRNWTLIEDETGLFVHFLYHIPANHKFRIIGRGLLSSLSADTDTIEISDERVNVLVAYAAYKFYQNLKGVPSPEDRTRYQQEADYWLKEYYRLRDMLCTYEPSRIPF